MQTDTHELAREVAKYLAIQMHSPRHSYPNPSDWKRMPEPGEYFERWRMPKVIEITGKSQSAIYRDVQLECFPAFYKDGRETYWISSQVIAWNHSRLGQPE